MGSPMQKAALTCLSLILLVWSKGPGVQSQKFQFGACRVEGVVFQQLWEAFRTVKDIVEEIEIQKDVVTPRGIKREHTHLGFICVSGQAQDNITSVQLLRREVLQNISVIQLLRGTMPLSMWLVCGWDCGLFIQGWGGQTSRLQGDPGPPQDAESCYFISALLRFYLNIVFKNYYEKAAEIRILKSYSTLANNFIVILSKLQPSQEKEMFSIRESARRHFLLYHKAFKQLNIEAARIKAFGEVDILLTWMQKFYQL